MNAVEQRELADAMRKIGVHLYAKKLRGGNVDHLEPVALEEAVGLWVRAGFVVTLEPPESRVLHLDRTEGPEL